MRFSFGNICTVSIGYGKHLTPSIIGISCNGYACIIGDCNDVALQILIEIICSVVVFQTANSAVQIVQVLVDILREICRVGYDFLNNVGTVKDVFVNLGAYGFLNTNTIVVILVRVVAKGLKLSAPFPSYRGSKIIGRVAVDM